VWQNQSRVLQLDQAINKQIQIEGAWGVKTMLRRATASHLKSLQDFEELERRTRTEQNNGGIEEAWTVRRAIDRGGLVDF
jgi:hypothetical protein